MDIKQLFLDPDPHDQQHPADNQPTADCYVDDRNKNYIIINSNHEISHVSTTEMKQQQQQQQRVASSSPPARNAQSGGNKNFNAAKNARNSQHEMAQQRGKDYEHVYFTNCARKGGRQTDDSLQGEFCLFLSAARLLYNLHLYFFYNFH